MNLNSRRNMSYVANLSPKNTASKHHKIKNSSESRGDYMLPKKSAKNSRVRNQITKIKENLLKFGHIREQIIANPDLQSPFEEYKNKKRPTKATHNLSLLVQNNGELVRPKYKKRTNTEDEFRYSLLLTLYLIT